METFPKSPYLVGVYEGKLDVDASYSCAVASGYGFGNQTRLFPTKMTESLRLSDRIKVLLVLAKLRTTHSTDTADISMTLVRGWAVQPDGE